MPAFRTGGSRQLRGESCDEQACFARAGVARRGLDQSSAQAADFNYGSRAPYTVNQPLNAYSWAGPYLGGNLGYAWGSVDNNPAKPSGFVGRRSGRLQLAERSVGVRRRGRHPGDRRRRHVCAVEILQPVVRHGARPRRLCLQQRAVLRHRRSGLRRIARRDLRPVGIPHQCRLDRRRRRRIRLCAELERQGRISLRRSRQQQFRHHRRVERLPLRH